MSSDDAKDVNWDDFTEGPRPDRKGAAAELGWSDFHYVFAAGVTFHPRDSGTSWEQTGAGCVRRTGGDGLFTLNANLPQGARIDYFTVQFCDASPRGSVAVLSAISTDGGLGLYVSLASSGDTGYQSRTSDYLGNVVDTETFAYVFSWFSQQPDDSLQLCGVRVEYRVPVAGGWSEVRYLSASGSTFVPQDSGTGIRYGGGGCISAFPVLVFSDGFESGSWDEWSTSSN